MMKYLEDKDYKKKQESKIYSDEKRKSQEMKILCFLETNRIL